MLAAIDILFRSESELREGYSVSEARRGVVLSGLEQSLTLSDLNDRTSHEVESGIPRDQNSERLFWLYRHGSTNDIVAELGRLDELFPGRYRTGTGFRSAPLSAQELRTYLTLWDTIDYPIIEGISERIDGRDKDFDLLVDQGLIVRTRVCVNHGGEFNRIVERTHRAAYAARTAMDSSSCWSMARDVHSLRWWRTTDEDQGRGILVRLYDCIPIPHKEVPIYEILQFRDRRRDELLSLRYHLETIYERISAAVDCDLALDTEVSRLEGSLSDYLQAGRDSGMRLRMLDLESQIKVEFDLRTGVAAAAVAYASGLPGFAAALVGVGGAFLPKLEISAKPAPRSLKSASTPYEYVTSVRDELFR
jgi:hypothetical protein